MRETTTTAAAEATTTTIKTAVAATNTHTALILLPFNKFLVQNLIDSTLRERERDYL